MSICIYKKFLFAVLPIVLLLPAAAAGNPDTPFLPGERLTFHVRWGFIPAGGAVLEVLPPEVIDGRRVHRFGLSAFTNPGIDMFYKVRDRIDSYTDLDLTRTVYYTRKTDGKSRKNERVVFDWEEGIARYSNFDESRPPIALEPGTFDPFAVFFAFRLQGLREGAVLTHPVTDGRRLITGRATVVRRENIETAMGKVNTFVVELGMEDIDGTFEKSKGAGMRIWVSADGYRIPVRIRSKVAVGSFVAELTDVSGTGWRPGAAGSDRVNDDLSRDP